MISHKTENNLGEYTIKVSRNSLNLILALDKAEQYSDFIIRFNNQKVNLGCKNNARQERAPLSCRVTFRSTTAE